MQRVVVWILIWLTTYIGVAVGQNLVPNGSFETYRSCPHQDNLLEEAVPWYNPNRATPDFYHQCFNTGQMALPPHSGQGMARLFFDRGWAEYLGIRLTKPLEAGTCYYYEMYVATDTPTKYLTETLGAYLSTQSVTAPGSSDMLNIRPQVLDGSSGISALQWQRISGIINARGDEQYLTIGSFYKTPPFLGFYYVFVDDISLVPIKLDLGKDTTLCGRASTRLLDATTPGAIGYLWNDGSKKSTLLASKAGEYAVKVITPCKTLNDTIRIDYALDFDLGSDTTLCNGQTLSLTIPTNTQSTYRWQDGSSKPNYVVNQAGQYSVQITQAACVVADTILIRYSLPPTLDLGADQELCGAETFTIKPVSTEGKFFWQDQFAGTERTVSQSGVFRASVRNDCATVTDSVTISYEACDCILYTPNSFTPNNDGLNDVFLTYGCGDITILSLSIFNRWGEIVFHTDQHPFQWDGYYHGERCPTGVYAWSIHYQLNQGKRVKLDHKQGPLSLIR